MCGEAALSGVVVILVVVDNTMTKAITTLETITVEEDVVEEVMKWFTTMELVHHRNLL